MFKGKKVAFYTLGCKLNFSESSSIAQSFEELGFERVKHTEVADVYVINTCSVTDMADKKCRQAIKKLIKLNHNAFIAVVGCYAQLKPEEISKIEGVDIVLGTQEKFNVQAYLSHLEKKENTQLYGCDFKLIEDFNPSFSYGDRTRCFLKIQDGCDYFCTYCTIPFARGRSRNMSIDKTVKLAKEIGEKGIKEIILTGVNIGDFGKSTDENFYNLISELDKIESIERYRISSIEPNLLTDEIIQFVAKSKKFMPHFHIPLQSGSNEVLKLMKRRYNRELFEEKVKLIKKYIPNAFIGVDLIAGSRGETEEYFEDAYNFVSSLPISFLHVFPYSERAGTKALEIDHIVEISERKKRAEKFHKLSDKFLHDFYKKHIGTRARVLFEDANHNGMMHGFTDNYIKVAVDYNANLANKIVDIEILDFHSENSMKALLIDSARYNFMPKF
ncbi:MAG: tRNA (N(6)-L-threonylcarbamoyladenosine(37)-C(2))-methylthiotransferase MtaB [Marinifilaceae bacterium]|jgi:threonylcarbamoyladenosine tRNA methylthiotransferase MtaB|nr:tRNA (N(6)-L-threonylcarbamoyladenosine(37)-C(2))-methylthiotransferase MtaB [Marinifilaceae bacterium]